LGGVPEGLGPALVELRERVDALAVGTLIGLRDDSGLDPVERRRRVIAASREAGLFHLGQAGERDEIVEPVLALVVARDTLASQGVGHLDGLFGPGPGVLAQVGEPLRSAYLAPMLAGDLRAGFAFTEPAGAARPSWARVDGETLVVNGHKSYVTGGADADFLTVLVDVEGRGPAMVVIDIGTPGVSLTRRFESLDGSHHAAFAFEDVRVPLDHIAGAPGEGLRRAMGKISEVRLAIAATCVGTSRWLVDEVTGHLEAPRRNGEPLGAREGVRIRYGDLRIRAYAARSTVYRTARLVDAGENALNETAAAKVFASEVVGELADTAIQLVGGEALAEDHPLCAAYRRVRAWRLAEGETDVLRLNVARGRLDLGLGRI
jgi:alkylation response protein AidB-like acyl-CoA dehydrogenase